MVAAIYNTIPHIEELDTGLQDREAVFAKLAPLLQKYNGQFGVALVHSHTKLKDDEIMLTDGYITKPTPTSHAPYYPSHWLPSGIPYEFSTTPTCDLPAELVREFQEIAGEDGHLGVFYTGSQDKDMVECEVSIDGVQTVTYHDRNALPDYDHVTEVGWVMDKGILKLGVLYLWLNGRHMCVT